MLNPKLGTDAIVASLQSITALVTAMGGSANRIVAYHYLYGKDNRLADVLYTLKPPAILVAWGGTQGGNFDGATVWKHRWDVVIRLGSQAQSGSPQSYEDLWWLICNGAVTGGTNIRSVQLVSGLDIMDTPSISHRQDEDGMDYFVGTFVIPEIGDN